MTYSATYLCLQCSRVQKHANVNGVFDMLFKTFRERDLTHLYAGERGCGYVNA